MSDNFNSNDRASQPTLKELGELFSEYINQPTQNNHQPDRNISGIFGGLEIIDSKSPQVIMYPGARMPLDPDIVKQLGERTPNQTVGGTEAISIDGRQREGDGRTLPAELIKLFYLGNLQENGKKLAEELASEKDFLSAADHQAIRDDLLGKTTVDEAKENNFLANRIRRHFEKCAEMGIPPEKVVEQMNEALKKSGASFRLKLEGKTDDHFNLSMVDEKKGEKLDKDGIYCSIFVSTKKK